MIYHLKNYKKRNWQKAKKVIFLNPSDTKKAYFIETGWAGIQNKKLKYQI